MPRLTAHLTSQLGVTPTKQLAAALVALAAVTGRLGSKQPAAGQAAGSATVHGSLGVTQQLAGLASGSAGVTGAVTVTVGIEYFEARSDGSSSLAAFVYRDRKLAGASAIAGASVVLADLGVSTPESATSAGAGSAIAEPTLNYGVSLLTSGNAAVSGELSVFGIRTVIDDAGAGVDVVVSIARGLVADVLGVAAVAGIIYPMRALSVGAVATAGVTVDLTVTAAPFVPRPEHVQIIEASKPLAMSVRAMPRATFYR